MAFSKIKTAVASKFSDMKGMELFRTSVGKDELWETYLASFPEGSNPIYRERTEHDCNCCKQFIRAVGNVVCIRDGKLDSIWDTNTNDVNYQVVADAMSKLVKSYPIENIFLHTEKTAGTDVTFEDMLDPLNIAKVWEHFFVNIPCGRGGDKNFVAKGIDIGTRLSESRAIHDVMYRSLNEIDMSSIDTVLELIAQNSLYRGEENRHSVESFKDLKRIFNQLPECDRDNFAWLKSRFASVSVSKIRNTAIGTLLVDLSSGMELDDAVKSFEAKVAPANYKRPTALVTKSMIESAKKKVEELGLTSALERRYAEITDISINDIIFADREARHSMKADVFDEISSKVRDKKPKKMDKIEEIGIDKFLNDIVPMADSIEVMMENSHIKNLVSLIAPVDATAGPLFKWDNNFSWAYNGDVTDSLKERVKQAGGDVTGDLCCRLAWYNFDDLDLHMIEPGGYEIYYGNRHSKSPCGGRLDVDMNAGSGQTREAVENIFYKDKSTMKEGTYQVVVHNYCKRESVDIGFEVDVDFMGEIYHFAYDRAVPNGARITVAEISYSKAKGIHITTSLPFVQPSKDVWNVQTGTYRKVNVIMNSPNHWGGHGVGNKHYFFMLNDCLNDGTARGFFNEYLKEDLNTHRKVLEIVGSKMKTKESEKQLSGLGFSSTQRNSIICRVSGSFSRLLKVMF